jgi:hypothetical protein
VHACTACRTVHGLTHHTQLWSVCQTLSAWMPIAMRPISSASHDPHAVCLCAYVAACSTSLLSNLALGVAPGGLRAADSLEPQDFLIRGVLLERSGNMLVMDTVRVGERIRFMVSGVWRGVSGGWVGGWVGGEAGGGQGSGYGSW